MLLTHALALSANQFLSKKTSYVRVCALGENWTSEIDFSRHEDNLPSHRGRWARLFYISFIIWCLWTKPTIWLILRSFFMQYFFWFKNGLFSKKPNKHYLKRFKTEQFHHLFFLTLVWTKLILPSFRMIKARDCKQSFKSDLLLVYRIYMPYYYTR